jgi:signal transduction histidine kinase
MQLQDEERRRMARLLHETIAQSLAALKMDLAVVKRYTHWKDAESREARQREAIQEASALADDCIREVRTLSYLLHPPLLDEAGLCTALQWYATGFGRRSGIEISLDLPAQLGRLPRNVETAVFRIVQECLTNIHRHAGSPDARIRLNTTDSAVLVEVSDHGHGMPYQMPDEQFGVGIMGMRERVKQFGGHMEIQSGSTGTTVTATLPYGEATYA